MIDRGIDGWGGGEGEGEGERGGGRNGKRDAVGKTVLHLSCSLGILSVTQVCVVYIYLFCKITVFFFMLLRVIV